MSAAPLEVTSVSSAARHPTREQSARIVTDPEWDRFLVAAKGNHHLQSTAWARVKASSGWQVLRLVIRDRGRIVGGIQILFRTVPLLGSLGYAPRGPVIQDCDPRLTERLFAELDRVMREERFFYLMIQPPEGDAHSVEILRTRGFAPTPVEVAPTATVAADLSQSPEELLASMRSSTKRGIRKSLSSELEVRLGGEADLATFHSLLAQTGQRKNFTPPSLGYFQDLWRQFSPDQVVLFLAETGGEVVAAELDIAFGDTLVSKRAGWSGSHPDLHPSARLIWEAMLWAKANGYKHYDLEGVAPDMARAILAGEPPPESSRRNQDIFKLGFGGRLLVLPDNHEYVYGKIAGWAHRNIWLKSALASGWRRKLAGAF